MVIECFVAMTTLYSPYKAIGYVCDGNPFEINRLGEEIFLTVTISNCFQVFRFNKLTNCLVSKTTSGNINCLKVSGDETYTAVDGSIVVYKRSEIVHKYAAHIKRISGMILIGNVLVSYDDSNIIKLLDTKARVIVAEMKVLQQSTISSMIHPASYVNKILIGFRNGQLELWNINKKILIYTLGSHLQYFKAKNRSSGSAESIGSVTALEQSPACDVVGVGFSTGDILLVNLKLDQVLFGFLQTGGAVTSLSFRSDAKAKSYPYLVSSTASGVLHVWNLGTSETSDTITRSLHSSLEEAHKGRICRVAFLPGEPIMVSNGEDNTLKVWIFDAPDGSARLHSSREGHSGFPTRIRYYGGTSQVSMRDNADASSCELVSAGSDGTLRLFNTAISNQNRELSQKPILKALGLLRRNEGLPQCIGFDFSESKERQWSNLVSIHEKHNTAFLWKYKQRVISDVMLKAPSSKSASHCSAAAFSMCGNFCLIGYSGGAIYKFNVQSGQIRGSYPKTSHSALKKGTEIQRAKLPANVLYKESPTATITGGASSASTAAHTELQEQQQHQQEVTGLFVDMTNSTLVSCGLDGFISFWDFNSQTLLHQVSVGSPLLLMVGFREANFVAVADQNRTVHVYDIHTFRVVRKYVNGHSQQITDIAFSPDGRRLLTSSLDSTVRVWELSTSRCLSWLRFNRPVMSIAISLSGEYLCVTQSDRNGIFMYADRSLFETVHFWKEPSAPTLVEDSCLIDEDGEIEGAAAGSPDDASSGVNEESPALLTSVQDEPLITQNRSDDKDTVSFSNCPRVFWSSLFHLEAIKLRNKLATPASATPAAPFFLPTVVRGEVGVAFPTMEEYAKMAPAIVSSAPGGQKRALTDSNGSGAAAPASKLMKTIGAVESKNEEGDAFDENDWSGMASAWQDDDTTAPDGAISSAAVSEMSSVTMEPAASIVAGPSKGKSRLLKNANLPRCKLMVLLQSSSDSAVLAYMKTLAAPAVDVDINALCTNDLELRQQIQDNPTSAPPLALWLQWLTRSSALGHDFELIQAYIHRTLAVYSELLLKSPVTLAEGSSLVSDLFALQSANDEMTNNFRLSVQRNLCMLKILANIPLN